MPETHAEIVRYRHTIAEVPQGARFMIGLEQRDYEDTVVKAFTEAIPRLYVLAYEDQTDLPPEIYRAIETLERDLQLDLTVEEQE